MKHKDFWLVVLVSSVAFAALTGLFFLLFEKSAYTRDSGWKGEARTNPYLAAKRLLEALGTETACFSGMPNQDERPAEGGTLILAEPQNASGDQGTDRLLEWVESGGHLVTVVQDFGEVAEWDQESPAHFNSISGRLGIEFWYDGPAGKTVEGTPPGYSEPLRVMFETSLQMGFIQGEEEGEAEEEAVESQPGPSFIFQDEEGIKAVAFDYGLGTVALLTDAAFMTNGSIDKFDHAHFLFALAGGGKRGGPVWLIYGRDTDSLASVLFAEIRPVILAFAAWLCFWLWRAIPRLGPVIPDPPPHRRKLMEHIEAGGNFLWRHHQGRRLLESTRSAVKRHLAARHPEWARLPKEKMVQAIRDKTHLTTMQIETALGETGGDDRDGFTFKMAVLGEIRRAL